jgi:hypothetical protein
MATQPDRLSLLRTKYRERIRAKKTELDELEKKLALLDELEEESNSIRTSAPSSGAGRYAKAKLTEAVLDTMSELGRSTIAGVKKHLLDNGFVPNGKNFTISIATALKRLAGQKKLGTELKDGKRIYWTLAPRFQMYNAQHHVGIVR